MEQKIKIPNSGKTKLDIEISLDENSNIITADNNIYQCLHKYEYWEAVIILLNKQQVVRYRRELKIKPIQYFKITERRKSKFEIFILGNIWRKRNNLKI